MKSINNVLHNKGQSEEVANISQMFEHTISSPKVLRKMARNGSIELLNNHPQHQHHQSTTELLSSERSLFNDPTLINMHTPKLEECKVTPFKPIKIKAYKSIVRATSKLRDCVDKIPSHILMPDDKFLIRFGVVVFM